MGIRTISTRPSSGEVWANAPEQEVAQKYYTRGFKESRRQLIERLLDPTLTLEDTARVLGRKMPERDVLAQIGYMTQADGIYTELSV